MAAATVCDRRGLVAAQAAAVRASLLRAVSGETMVRRFFLWQVVNCSSGPRSAVQHSARGDGDRLARRAAACVADLGDRAVVVGDDPGVLDRAGQQHRAAVARARGSVLVEGSRYPLDMFWHIARTTPLTLLLAIARLIAVSRAAAATGRAANASCTCCGLAGCCGSA